MRNGQPGVILPHGCIIKEEISITWNTGLITVWIRKKVSRNGDAGKVCGGNVYRPGERGEELSEGCLYRQKSVRIL